MTVSDHLHHLPFIDGTQACADVDPDLFFYADHERAADRRRRDADARAVCHPCPLREACLDWAVRHDEQGVWGGLNEDERYRLPAVAVERRRRHVVQRRYGGAS